MTVFFSIVPRFQKGQGTKGTFPKHKLFRKSVFLHNQCPYFVDETRQTCDCDRHVRINVRIDAQIASFTYPNVSEEVKKKWIC